jgi:hypothetical protein
MARLAIRKAQSPLSIEIAPQSQNHWSTFLSGDPLKAPKPKAPRRTAPKKTAAKSKKSTS